jgi:DNA invertase Pin-like site-specific DNA recombinase
MIKANAEWEFVGIYTDEGISGTSTNRREGFNRMIADALAGKIDLIC